MKVALGEGGAEAEGSGCTGYDPGFEGAVSIVAFQPMADALAEGEVVEIAGELADWAVGNGDGVDKALVAHLFGAKEAEVERRSLDVPQPGPLQEVAPLNAEGDDLAWLLHGGEQCGAEARGDDLVSVEIEDPGMAEGDVHEAPVLVRGPVVEDALVDVGAGAARDLEGAIGAEGVEDVDVIGPGDGVEAGREILLLIRR